MKIDHLVLTVRDIPDTCHFYAEVLGMEVRTFKAGTRYALHFGAQKINLHEVGNEFEPKANSPTPGSVDLCFVTDESLSDVTQRLSQNNIAIIEGPVARTGALGPLQSIYFRDPDGNLIEVSNQVNSA
jgi:catechol 2,3-dioxygenase-like lactoylglutathione lyase family enzyme